ncbi:glycosyltransferase family 4 protein [Alteromonas sp. K632G]|jgi:glycosyltransferase involved in cell wall biosynthesis|uniref:glycosyltransferase family 4 protein n=1 Tax=Alteromonas sp. K632G TaxID=2820757 RepID=UPI000C1093D5|nr:glycosyltransferase family 4 protein [Alteromonas sp. K632G]MBO7922669.1 glycosyltransferase family 4 protein [Alteromonas sp. K632G]PHS59382.1 MAG: phosphatidylinositol glycan [Alteromonas sp.]
MNIKQSTSMKTIFFAHSVNVIGGAERVTLSVLNCLKEKYHCVFLSPEGNNLGKEASTSGATFEPIKALQPELSKPIQSALQLIQYYRIFKRHKPSLVYTGDLLALRSLQPICKFLSIPLVCHVHYPYEEGFMKWALKKRYSPAAFIFCSHELKEKLSVTLNKLCPTSHMHVIHNGVNTTQFPALPAPKNLIPHIGIIANLQFRKGHDDFLKMAQILTQKGVDAHYDIIGGDILQEPRETYLKELADDLEVSDRVTFHGQLSNVKSALTKLDIYVCASHEEAFPISLLEAMSAQKSIVSTNVNGIPEMLKHGYTALLSDKEDPLTLSKNVELLLNDSELSARLRNNCRKEAVTRFDISLFEANISQILEELVID